jgi:hypothetical protein
VHTHTNAYDQTDGDNTARDPATPLADREQFTLDLKAKANGVFGKGKPQDFFVAGALYEQALGAWMYVVKEQTSDGDDIRLIDTIM